MISKQLMDILIKNAKLREKQYPVSIAIKNGIITKILPAKSELVPEIESKSKKVIDAKENLVTPTFIDPHIHMDRAFISKDYSFYNSGIINKSKEIILEIKKAFTVEDVFKRASKTVESGIQNGTTKFRSHVDIDSAAGLKGLEGLVETKKKYKNIAHIQIAAFPQQGIYNCPGLDKLMKKAMKNGADVVGGSPHKERFDDDARKHIDFCFKLAKHYNADIDIHLENTNGFSSETLRYLSVKTIKEKYHGRVTISGNLQADDTTCESKLISLLSEAAIHVTTTPASALMLHGKTFSIKQFLNAGINVAFGQDFLKDPVYPAWGREDPLEIGLLAAHAAKMNHPHEIETLFNMSTNNSAKILRLKKYGIAEGSPADMNILDAPNVQEAFRKLSDRLYVISNGRLLATNKTIRTLNL